VGLLVPECAGYGRDSPRLVKGGVQVPAMPPRRFGLGDGDPEAIPTAIRVTKQGIARSCTHRLASFPVHVSSRRRSPGRRKGPARGSLLAVEAGPVTDLIRQEKSRFPPNWDAVHGSVSRYGWDRARFRDRLYS